MKTVCLVIIIVLCLSSTCVMDPDDTPKYVLTIKNNSSKDINFLLSSYYPDTILPVDPYILKHPNTLVESTISSYSQKNAGLLNIKDTTIIFILDNWQVRNYPWDSIRKNHLVLKRFEFTLKDFQVLKWTVEYP